MPSRLLFRRFGSVLRLSRWLRRRLTAPGLLVAGTAVTAGTFGIDTHRTLAFQVFSLCAALLLVAILGSLRFRPKLRLTRTLPHCATAGTMVSYTVHVTNHGTRDQAGLLLLDLLALRLPSFEELRTAAASQPEGNWLDRWLGYRTWARLVQSAQGARIPPLPIPGISPGETVAVDIPLLSTRRGELRFEELLVARPDPLGLVNAFYRVAAPDSLLVLPRQVAAPTFSLTAARSHQPGGMNLAQHVGDSEEFVSLRDYRPGDPLRHIHWRYSARLGQPVVKEFQDQFFIRQALVLDACTRPGPLFEYSVSLCAGLTAQRWSQDALLELFCIVGSGEVSLTAGRGLGERRQLLALLAAVQPLPGGDFQAHSAAVRRQANRISAATLVLNHWDAPRQALVRELTRRRMPVAVLIVCDRPEAIEPGPPAAACRHFQLLSIPARDRPADAAAAAAPAS